jgi:hypothetical protein
MFFQTSESNEVSLSTKDGSGNKWTTFGVSDFRKPRSTRSTSNQKRNCNAKPSPMLNYFAAVIDSLEHSSLYSTRLNKPTLPTAFSGASIMMRSSTNPNLRHWLIRLSFTWDIMVYSGASTPGTSPRSTA